MAQDDRSSDAPRRPPLPPATPAGRAASERREADGVGFAPLAPRPGAEPHRLPAETTPPAAPEPAEPEAPQVFDVDAPWDADPEFEFDLSPSEIAAKKRKAERAERAERAARAEAQQSNRQLRKPKPSRWGAWSLGRSSTERHDRELEREREAAEEP